MVTKANNRFAYQDTGPSGLDLTRRFEIWTRQKTAPSPSYADSCRMGEVAAVKMSDGATGGGEEGEREVSVGGASWQYEWTPPGA